MSRSSVYPKAIYADNGVSGGTYTSGPPKLVVHTTETSGMPGYNNGLSAPHITYDPRSRIFVQHRTFKEAARALRNETGGVQTNRASALQIEIICYSSKPTADQQPYRDWVGDLDKIPGALEDLSEFVHWACTDWGIQKVWPGKQAFSYSQANAAGFRMTLAQWVSFNGVCGHQHIPEQTHWDPGAIDWKRLLPAAAPLEEDELTPAQEKALNTLVALFESRAENPPPWGATNWNQYLDEVWTGPTTSDPGPLNPVTHVQLAKVYSVLKFALGKMAPSGTDIDAVIAEIVGRLEE